MRRDAEPGWQHRNEAVLPDDPAFDALGEAIESQLADLVAYCRELIDQETDAVSTAQSVLDSAHSLLNDPESLRAWLFALARRKALAARQGGSAQADSPRPDEILDLVHRHGIRPQDLPVVLGIPAIEADERLAAAEADYDSRRAERVDGDSDRFRNNGWHDETGWDGWAERDHWTELNDRDEPDDGQRLDDLEGLMRTPPDSAGRHAARRFSGGSWQARAGGRARLAAATAVVVAVIGVGAAYLADSAHGGQPSPAGLQSSHHPAPASPTPVSTPSPTPTATPKHSPAPSKAATVVQPPPAPTSTKPKPKPSQTTTSPPPTTPPPTTPPVSPSAAAS